MQSIRHLGAGIADIMPLVVTDATRNVRFAAPVPVSLLASAGDQLAGLLGCNRERTARLSQSADPAYAWLAVGTEQGA